jgi:hypothetical protein
MRTREILMRPVSYDFLKNLWIFFFGDALFHSQDGALDAPWSYASSGTIGIAVAHREG